MKFIHLFVIILAITLVTSTKIRNDRRRKEKQPSNNVFYQFLLGVLSTLSGDAKFIDECSQEVKGWEAAGTAEESGEAMTTELKDQDTIYDKAIKMCQKVIDMICEFKDDIVKYLTGQFRRYVRLFLAGKTRRRRFSWSITGLFDSAKSAISKAANSVSKGLSKVKDAVVDGVKWVGKKAEDIMEHIKTKLNEVFKPVFDLYNNMKARVVKYLKEHPFLANLLLFCKCFIKNKGVENIKSMYNAAKAFITLIPQLATVGGWIQLVANLICGYADLAEAIKEIKAGMSSRTKPEKYNHYGKFTGLLMKVVGGS